MQAKFIKKFALSQNFRIFECYLLSHKKYRNKLKFQRLDLTGVKINKNKFFLFVLNFREKKIGKLKIMRKLLLVAMTMSLTAISCGEDRDENTTQQPTLSQKIVGTWKITKKESNGVNIPASNPCQNLGNFVFSQLAHNTQIYESFAKVQIF